MSQRICSFPPIARKDARLLILGTMPGAASLQNQDYYAFRQNQFWRIMADFIGVPFPALGPLKRGVDDTEYKKFIQKMKREVVKHGIAIWDTLQSCTRVGSSLDSAIRAEVPNDFTLFLRTHRHITDVFFNGTPSSVFFRRHVKLPPEIAARLTFHILPSTSPARAMKTGEKQKIWHKELKKVLR